MRPVTDRDPETHEVVEGYNVHALDHATGSPLEVFVPRAKASKEYTHALVMQEVDKVRGIRALPSSLNDTASG